MEIKKTEGCLKRIFKNMDFFSVTFQFRVDNKKKFNSVCGGVCFLFYLMGIIAYVLKSFYDYISFTDFKILFNDKYEDKTKIEINDKRFFYSFKFTYEELLETQINPEIDYDVLKSKYKDTFVIEHNYVLKNIETGITNKTKIPITDCDLEHIKRFDKSIPQNATFSNFYKNHICFKYQNYSIFGLYTDKIMSYIEVVLKLNSTTYSKNFTAMKDIFSKVNFNFNPYYSDYIYDVTNLTYPITNRIESTVYSYLDLNYYERTNIFLNELIFIQDENLIFKQQMNNTYIKYSNFDRSLYPILGRFDKSMNYSDKYNLIKYFIRPNMKKSVILVTLIKIPEFLSGISAICTNSLILLNLIISYFNHVKAKQKIIQKIMKYNDIIKIQNKGYFNYFTRHLKEKMIDMQELSAKYNNILSNTKNNIFDKNKKLKNITDKSINNSNLPDEKIKDNKKKFFFLNETKTEKKSNLLSSDLINITSKEKYCDREINFSKQEQNETNKTNKYSCEKRKLSETENISENPNIENLEKIKITEFYSKNPNNLKSYNSKIVFNSKEEINFTEFNDRLSSKKNIKNYQNLNMLNVTDNVLESNKHTHRIKKTKYKICSPNKLNKPHIILINSIQDNHQNKNISTDSKINMINQTKFKQTYNDLVIENINNFDKNENIQHSNNIIKEIEFKTEKSYKNENKCLNSNFTKAGKENVIFDAFGKKMEQNYNKTHNIKFKNPMKLSCLELFFNCIICKNELKKKKKIFDIAEEKFNYNLDILTYLKKMLEIDILKYLILDKNLLNIMNFISKPSVSYKTQEIDYNNDFKLFFNDQSPVKEINMVAIKDSFDNIVFNRNNKNTSDKYNSFTKIEYKMMKLFMNQIEEINK